MRIDDNKQVEQIMKLQLISQIMGSLSKDSSAFGVMLESLLNASQESNNKIDLGQLGLGEIDLKNLGEGGKEKLESSLNEIKSSIGSSGRADIDKTVEQAARKFGVDKDLIMAVIKQESDFNPNVVSSAGAMGLMQLMPENVREEGVSNPYDIQENINAGTKQLKDLLNMYGNRKEMALAAYNAGPGTLRNRNVKDVSDIYKLPYETRDYVKKVMKYYGK